MRIFGMLDDINELSKKISEVVDVDIEVECEELSDEHQSAIDNVCVPYLNDDVYKPIASAGNKVIDEEEPEVQLGGFKLGEGMSLKPSLEAFNGNDVVDEAPMKLANEDKRNNVIERLTPEQKAKEVINGLMSWNKDFKKPEYDMDSTKLKISNNDAKTIIKRGW